MKVFAYCTQPAKRAVQRATGVEPLTSPPYAAGNFLPQYLEWHDLLYFRLHGDRGTPGTWWGENRAGNRYDALTLSLVNQASLRGAVVVVANCYGADDDPMVGAFYRSGASFVIAGPGPNYAAGSRVIGTDLLVMWLIRFMNWGAEVERALQWAKARLLMTGWRTTDRDALAFRIIEEA